MEFRKSTLFAFIYTVVFFYNTNHVNAQTFPPVVLNVDCASAVTNDSVCIDFKVDNFTNVESIQFGISFDATLVIPKCPVNFSNSALGATISDANLNCLTGENGFINFVWLADPTTIPDGSIIFTLCFDVIGNAGNSSPIIINDFISSEICQTDANGNSICTNDITVNACPIEITSNTLVAFANKCDADGINNIDNASLTFYAAGGTPPYTYNITPGPFTGTLNTAGERVTIPNIPQANYSILITDNAGLTFNLGPILISNSFPFFIDSVSLKNPTCADRMNGVITVFDLEGGVTPFKYQWSNLISGTNFNTIDELGLGEYSVTITDGSGCILKDTFTLTIDTLKLNLQVTKDASCADIRNGAITFGATGGTNWEVGQPYEYQLNSANWVRFTPPFSITNIAGGNFTLNVRDSLGCDTDVRTFTMPVDRVINMTFEKTDISCFGAKDGSVIMTASPLAEYTFINIQNFDQVKADTLIFTDLEPGNYRYRVIDIDGCRDTIFFSIIEPDPLVLNEVIVNPGCSTVGSITLNPSGGTLPYIYTWDPPQPGNPNALTNLSGGSYSVTVTDANDCTTTLTTTLNNQGSLDITPQIIKPISCFGVNDATLRVDILSANGPFLITWRDGIGNIIGSFQTIQNLGPGTYSVEVKANDGCSNTKSITILDVPGFNISVNVTNALCANTEGQAIVTVNGNPPGFTYEWSRNGNPSIIATSNILMAGAGLYDLSVIDPSGCTKDTVITITSPPAITFETPTTTAANCTSANSGTATIPNAPTGMNFTWSSGETSVTATSLPAGLNWVIATQGLCDSDTLFFNIDPPGPLTFPAPETRNVTCVGLETGQGLITNGPSGLSYEWSSGEISTFGFAIMLPAGENWVLARSGSCVSDTVFFTVGTNPPLILDESQTVIQNVTCFGDTNGSITVQAIGGTGLSYRYSWTNLNNNTNQARNLAAGGYEVVIMDSNNCTTKDTLFITQPDPLVASVDRIRTVELDCNNQDQGKIVLSTIGGNPGLKAYTWEGGVTADRETASNLSAGTYCATVSDNKGCKDTICYTLVAPAPLVGRLNPTPEPICNGGTTCISVDTITGGTGNQYTFQITTGGIRYPIDSCVTVFAGSYRITLYDSVGCDINFDITIGQPDPITVDLGDDLDIQLGLPSPIINALIDSPFPIDTLFWTPLDSLLCLTSNCQTIEVFPAETTTYVLTATDINGCTGTGEVTVNVKDVRSVYFANIFTPNRDGNNDFFQVAVGPGVAIVNSFAIFDRWGNQVFFKENYMPDAAGIDGWDGTFNGRPLDPGVFVYTARVLFIDGKVIDYSGSVTVAAKVKN